MGTWLRHVRYDEIEQTSSMIAQHRAALGSGTLRANLVLQKPISLPDETPGRRWGSHFCSAWAKSCPASLALANAREADHRPTRFSARPTWDARPKLVIGAAPPLVDKCPRSEYSPLHSHRTGRRSMGRCRHDRWQAQWSCSRQEQSLEAGRGRCPRRLLIPSAVLHTPSQQGLL